MEEFTDNQQFNDFENPEPKRPFGLSFLCVLSFINAVLECLGNLVKFLAYDMFKTMSTDEDYFEVIEKLGMDEDDVAMGFDLILSASRTYYLLMALLFVGSFVGVYKMWHLQKRGFHFYAIAQILILIATASMANALFATSDAVLTALFILAYFLLAKKYMTDAE